MVMKKDSNDVAREVGPDGLRSMLIALTEQTLATKEPPKEAEPKPKYESSPADLAISYLRDNGLGKGDDLALRYWKEDFYRWNSRRYDQVSDGEMSASVTRYLQTRPRDRHRISRNLVANVILNLKGLCHLSEAIEPPSWLDGGQATPAPTSVSMANGILDVEQLLRGGADLRPHSPRFFHLASLPYAYDPDAKCGRWESILSVILPDEGLRDLIQEWFGYNLVHDTSQHRFVLMHGDGANGKSLVCTVLKSMLGRSSYSTVGLEALSPIRTFPMAPMQGKLANIVEEIGEVDRASEGIIKQVVGGTEMQVERKFKDAFNLVPTTRLTYATNVLPRFVDRSDGLWRRLLLIPFRVQIPEDRQDKRLATMAYWEQSGELAGVFRWALDGLRRLRERGRFVEPKVCRIAKQEYKRDSNPADTFLREHCVEDPSASTTSSELYGEYKVFVLDQGLRPLGAPQFCRQIERTFPSASLSPNALHQPDGKRCRVWTGLRMRTAEDDQGDEAAFADKMRNDCELDLEPRPIEIPEHGEQEN